jgi:hypothetical protein
MFRLDKHIEILLLKNDCVIVPNFGGFVTHHVSAHLDEDDGMMLPPKITVGFNQQLTINDSLLAQSYVEAYDYSYPEALRVLDEEIIQLREMIQEYGYFDIHSVGRIKLNGNGNYTFEPTSAGILSPCLYGLSGISTTEEENFITKKEASEKMRVASYNNYSKNNDEDKVIRISTTSLRRVMVACIVIFLLMVVPLMNRSTNKNQLISGIDTSTLFNFIQNNAHTITHDFKVSNNKVSLHKNKPNSTVSEKKQAVNLQPEKIQNNKSEEILNNTAQDKFTVVIAARISQKNAESYVSDLHKRGKPLAQVIGIGKSRKVVYGTFNNKEEAQKMKKKLSADKEFEYAWVTKL